MKLRFTLYIWFTLLCGSHIFGSHHILVHIIFLVHIVPLVHIIFLVHIISLVRVISFGLNYIFGSHQIFGGLQHIFGFSIKIKVLQLQHNLSHFLLNQGFQLNQFVKKFQSVLKKFQPNNSTNVPVQFSFLAPDTQYNLRFLSSG